MTHPADAWALDDADLRPASLRDAEDVAALLTTLGYACDAADAGGRILNVVDNERQALLVARDRDGAVCGLIAMDYMYYLPLDTTTCRITAMVVTPEAQGRGLGKALLRAAEQRARDAGAARIEITSGSQRTEAHRFYLDAGYNGGTVRFVKYLTA